MNLLCSLHTYMPQATEPLSNLLHNSIHLEHFYIRIFFDNDFLFLLFTFFVFFAVNYHTLLCNFGNPLYFYITQSSIEVVKKRNRNKLLPYNRFQRKKKPGKLEAISTKTAVNFPKSIILHTAIFFYTFFTNSCSFYFYGSLIYYRKLFCFIV